MYGDMPFEMMRTFNGEVFELSGHLSRLHAGLKILQIDMRDDLRRAVRAVIKANTFADDDEHRILINVSRGILPMYEDTGETLGTNVIVADFPLRWATKGMGKMFDVGVGLQTVPQQAIPHRFLDAKIKSRSRLHYKMAQLQCDPRAWPLLLDEHGFVAEGTGYNFFCVLENQVLTPPPHNSLIGVSQTYIGTLHRVQVVPISPYMVHGSSEVFISATPFCMLPVTMMDGVPIGNGMPGPVFNKILSQWGAAVGVDIKHQIQNWDVGTVPWHQQWGKQQ
jgi:branched-chain amino acid aminotransferase